MINLVETNKPSYQYCESNYENLNQICSPLVNLGIDYFLYLKTMQDGQFLYLFNYLPFLKDWLFTPGGYGDIFKAFYGKHEQKSYILTPYDEDSLKKDRSISLLKHHEIQSSFNIFKRDGLGNAVAYSFFSTIPDPLFSSFYFENINLLEHFCQYFEEKARTLINPIGGYKFANFYESLNISTNFTEKDILSNKINQFYIETKIPCILNKVNNTKIKIKKRELECLNYLSLGKTMKEIARALNLSPRSVEFYLQNIKKKSGLNRGELIAHFVSNFSMYNSYSSMNK